MSESKTEKAVSVTQSVTSSRAFIPFTGGLIIFVYAFFWPEGYGTWLGSIVRSFRVASGF